MRPRAAGDLSATTRYVKILNAEDTKAADVMATILGDVGLHSGGLRAVADPCGSPGPLHCCEYGL
jgi:hypothetical protein